MGPPADSDRLYLLNKNPYWTEMYRHTTEDSFWRVRNILPHLKAITPAVLVVGGWYDAEDLYGTLMTYQAIRRQSPATDCKLIMGPWSHGAWYFGNGDKLGEIPFGANTAERLREAELRFFKEHLKDGPVADLPQALLFETGENEWKSLPQWPPAGAEAKALPAGAREAFLTSTARSSAFDEYLSDPANPVPYFPNAPQEMVKEYMIADQRFLSDRQDVLSYLSDPLKDDFTMAGPISADLFVAASKSDADFDVKIIDVYSGEAPGHLAGYQQLVRGEPFRGKFRKSFEKPEPFKPDKVEEIRFYMPDVYHCFKKGHRIMVQVAEFVVSAHRPQPADVQRNSQCQIGRFCDRDGTHLSLAPDCFFCGSEFGTPLKSAHLKFLSFPVWTCTTSLRLSASLIAGRIKPTCSKFPLPPRCAWGPSP